ncbi:MAG: electron transfer flavoprotein subunit beta/FixA family protein [Bacteroidales bacterium]|nr:electron transfer flavoprotein subunit beta/FixA family protein [Bacteroidales bacterium]
MSFRIVVLAKQVPDTRNVGKDAMKEDGTINRAVLPAIFNPDDLNALEMALEVKSQIPDATVHVITMGPTRATDIIREAMYRGADGGFLLSDAKFAGSDTLATSYALSKAVEKLNPNLIFCGLQAIDGDTAQVGPQIAEKLHFAQVTYAEEIVSVEPQTMTIKRRLEHGFEIVKAKLPLLVTVHSSAKTCRSRKANLVLKYKYAKSKTEMESVGAPYKKLYEERPYLHIEEWNADAVNANVEQLGLNGSPTKVKKVDNIVLTQKDSKVLSACDNDIEQMMVELIDSKVIGG